MNELVLINEPLYMGIATVLLAQLIANSHSERLYLGVIMYTLTLGGLVWCGGVYVAQLVRAYPEYNLLFPSVTSLLMGAILGGVLVVWRQCMFVIFTSVLGRAK